jgi:hypothetical protein
MRRAEADPIGRRKRAAERRPSFATHGPRNDAEYETFLAMHGSSPF